MGIKYDGMIKVKIQVVKELTNTDVSGVSSMTVGWGDQLLGGGLTRINIVDSTELARYTALYRYFSIQGVRMEYKPYGFNAGSTNIASEECLVGSNAVGNALNVTTIRLAVDFIARRANQNFNKYVGVAKARMKNTGALSGSVNTSGSRWSDVQSLDQYHEGLTEFIIQNLGLPADQPSGMMYVTYFVWFKTQRTG